MRRFLAFAVVVTALGWMTVRPGFAAQETWVGTISDSQCGADHGGEVDERECTLKCAKLDYAYVFVTDGKVKAITNQNFPTLAAHAGRKVKLTGEQKGEAIVVSKIE